MYNCTFMAGTIKYFSNCLHFQFKIHIRHFHRNRLSILRKVLQKKKTFIFLEYINANQNRFQYISNQFLQQPLLLDIDDAQCIRYRYIRFIDWEGASLVLESCIKKTSSKSKQAISKLAYMKSENSIAYSFLIKFFAIQLSLAVVVFFNKFILKYRTKKKNHQEMEWTKNETCIVTYILHSLIILSTCKDRYIPTYCYIYVPKNELPFGSVWTLLS